jgi:alcohol dehydrogenase (cytochrome c)
MKSTTHTTLLAFRRSALAIALSSLTAAGATAAMTGGPSQEDFLQAGQQDSNWLLPSHTYSGNRYIESDQISRDDVAQLKRAWQFKIPDNGPMEGVPIVWNGTMYISSSHDHVYALDAKTGQLKWEFQYKPHVLAFAANRGVAVMDGNVYIATLDGHLIALNAETGNKVWDELAVHDQRNSFYTMAPVPYKDMLLLGVANGDWGGVGYITAFDAKTGKRKWEWNTVPGPGEAGHDTWSGDSWKRGGAATWAGVAIDPASDTLYISCGNPQPDFLGTAREGKNLYSDSVVALDIAGSKPQVKWYYQFIPHDTHDWDPAMPPVLFKGKVAGQDRSMLAVGDKAGNFWMLDASDGKLIDHTSVSFQKGLNSEPSKQGNIACPNTNGGVEYNGGAYDPNTNTFFVPSTNQCGLWKSQDRAVYIAGQFYLGGAFPSVVGPDTGWFNAIDVSNGTFKWRHHFGLPANGSALVTSGGVVFTGELSGNFDAFDTQTGKILWQYDTGSPITAPPAAYNIGGTEYIAVASGGPGNLRVPELPEKDAGAMVSVFAVGS